MISFVLKPGIFRIMPKLNIKRVPLVDLLHTSFKFTILYPNLLNHGSAKCKYCVDISTD